MATHYTLPTVTIPKGDSLNIYIPSDSLTGDDLLGAIALLLSSIRTGVADNLSTIETTLAVFTMAIPEMAITLSSLKTFEVTTIQVGASDLESVLDQSRETTGALADFPWLTQPSAGALTVTTVEGVYASVASLLMAIGKQGGSGPEAAAVKARPAALISRFGIPEDQQNILPGHTYGPTLEGLDRVYTAFSTYTEPRAMIVRYFLAVSHQQGHLPLKLEILMTNFRMMRGAGMTHVDAMVKFMNMHPWTVRVPELLPYYEKLSKEMEQFVKIPADVRSYHRLLVPQGDFLFLTPEYRPLIAVAGSFVEQVEKTFANYVYGKGDYATLIQKVQSYQPGTAVYIGSGTLAAKLGLQDMTLPQITTKSSPSKTKMV
jgi:hypothetical protein